MSRKAKPKLAPVFGKEEMLYLVKGRIWDSENVEMIKTLTSNSLFNSYATLMPELLIS